MSTTENREAAFIGLITAGATHELRNVLAIVKESSGLIADIINSTDRSGTSKPEKLMRATGRIEAQIKRGSELLTSLNRFAHSLDHAEDEIDLDEAAQQIPFLCQRVARRGRHQLQVLPGDQGQRVVVNLLRLQMALYAAVECCLEQLPEGGTLNLRPVRYGDRTSLEFNGEVGGQAVRFAPSEATAWNKLAPALEDLGACVEKIEAVQGFRLALSR
jgi:C4-dicarboxylate-specific signal transduction histidine kinase